MYVYMQMYSYLPDRARDANANQRKIGKAVYGERLLHSHTLTHPTHLLHLCNGGTFSKTN